MKRLLTLGLVFLTLILPIASLAYEESIEFAVRDFHTIAAEQAVAHELMLFPSFSAPNEVGFILSKASSSSGGHPTLSMMVNDFGICYYLEDDAAAVALMAEAEKIFGEYTLEETTIVYLDFINGIVR